MKIQVTNSDGKVRKENMRKSTLVKIKERKEERYVKERKVEKKVRAIWKGNLRFLRSKVRKVKSYNKSEKEGS